MAGDTDFATSVCSGGILGPASPSLLNCIKFSNSGRYFSALCDFGVVSVCELKVASCDVDTGANITVVSAKRLTFGKGELLESHTWSSDDQVFVVAGCKVYLFQVSKEFSSLHSIPLYYMPKDISLILRDSPSVNKVYSLAVAGPNGVELYQMHIGDTFNMGECPSLHSDLAIALVQFSPDKQYLAVAALDGHFGIWTVSSLDTDHKEFWYVHLKTVRITSMEFSPDSSMVAVAGWEGSWHSYRKTVQNERLTWVEFHHGQSTDRVSGDLPGSLISWSPDNRFIRLTQCKENKCSLSTYDTQTLVTTMTPLDGIVKGIGSPGSASGNYSLCFLRSKQCLTVPWPVSQAGPFNTTPASKPHTELLYQESLEGSLLVQLSGEGGVTLKWRRSTQQHLALLREMSRKGTHMTEVYQPSNTQQCTPICENPAVDNGKHQEDQHSSKSSTCDQDGFLRPQVGDGIKTVADGAHGKARENCVSSAEDGDKDVLMSTDAQGKDDQTLQRKDSSISESENLKEVEPRSSEMSVEIRDVWSTESDPKNTPQQDSVVLMSETDGCSCGRVGLSKSPQGFSIKERHPNAEKQSTSCSMDRTSELSSDVICIEAPFLNPRFFQRSSAYSSPLLSGSSVELLNSTNYVVVVVLPLLAYVHHHMDEEWRTLLFPCAVKCCCITNDKYLALLTNDGRIRIWCLESMEMRHSSHEVLCSMNTGFQRFIMSGTPHESQFSIIKVDKTGTGEMLRISFQPTDGDSCVSVNRLPVCYPDLLSHNCSSQLCGSIGHLIIFKESHSEDRDQTKPNQECGEDGTLLKWVVVVPDLRISRTFLEGRDCSLEGFVIRHHSASYKLNTLAMING